jgi:hypothetical protein
MTLFVLGNLSTPAPPFPVYPGPDEPLRSEVEGQERSRSFTGPEEVTVGTTQDTVVDDVIQASTSVSVAITGERGVRRAAVPRRRRAACLQACTNAARIGAPSSPTASCRAACPTRRSPPIWPGCETPAPPDHHPNPHPNPCGCNSGSDPAARSPLRTNASTSGIQAGRTFDAEAADTTTRAYNGDQLVAEVPRTTTKTTARFKVRNPAPPRLRHAAQ